MKATINIRRLAGLGLVVAVAAAILFALRTSPRPQPASSQETSDPQHLVEILQYLESDYPAAVASKSESELAEQRSLASEAASLAQQVPKMPACAERVAGIGARVNQAADPPGVSRDCASLVDDLVAASGASRAPSVPPDLAEGAQLYAQTCAVCHGPEGRGDGPAAAALTPKPASFHSNDVMAGLTPFKAFNVIRFGVHGTAMAPFETLDEGRRWALAFYLFSLRQPACDDDRPSRVSLDALANRTDEQFAKTEGADHVACLRRHLPVLDAPAMLAVARSQIEQAEHLARQGDPASAEKAVLDAYLTEIEPIEPWLHAHDANSVTSIEASFTTLRAALQRGDPRASEDAARLMTLLDRAAGPHASTTKLSAFFFALLVVVREGFEAAVIVTALLAVLKKRKQVSRARWVHAGWISAIAIGAVVFVLGRKLLAGAMDEKLEGTLAFVAAAMLLHAALWLNARSTTRKTMGELRQRTRGAVDRGAIALFGIAFLAVFRESFETAVFLEALSVDAPSAVSWGACAGAVTLLGLVGAVSRLGLRLPMQALFKISTVLLVVTAVVLVGEGIHSFQEIGILSSYPMPFFRIDLLGVYPDRLGVLAQVALSVAPLLWKALRPAPTPKEPSLEAAD